MQVDGCTVQGGRGQGAEGRFASSHFSCLAINHGVCHNSDIDVDTGDVKAETEI